MDSKRHDTKFYLPSVPFWIMDDLDLDLRKGLLYALVLNKGYMVWDYNYIAKVLRCSRSTVIRDMKELSDKGLIYSEQLVFGSRKRNIYVAAETKKGARSWEEVQSLMQQGKAHLYKMKSL